MTTRRKREGIAWDHTRAGAAAKEQAITAGITQKNRASRTATDST